MKITVGKLVLIVADDATVDVTDQTNILVGTHEKEQSHVFMSNSRPGVTHTVTYRDGKFWCDCEHFEHTQDTPERDNCWHIKEFKKTRFVKA